jgi:carbon monoxide dehydrogenase subunit G
VLRSDSDTDFWAGRRRQHRGRRQGRDRRGTSRRDGRSEQSSVDRKTRTVVTDGEGQFKIVELRPGIYTVTFSLPGFSSVRREGIELTTGFTAAVNVELKIGDVAETVTVSGQSPIVDVQNTKQQTRVA